MDGVTLPSVISILVGSPWSPVTGNLVQAGVITGGVHTSTAPGGVLLVPAYAPGRSLRSLAEFGGLSAGPPTTGSAASDLEAASIAENADTYAGPSWDCSPTVRPRF
jgi:hypothetical protein